MSTRLATAIAIATSALLLAAIPPLAAQSPRTLDLNVPGHEDAASSSRTIEVAVQYNFTIPMKTDSLEAQRGSLEAGRRMIYEIAASECRVLLATIASTCELSRINVQSSSQRHSPMQEVATIGGNASYRIRPKAPR